MHTIDRYFPILTDLLKLVKKLQYTEGSVILVPHFSWHVSFLKDSKRLSYLWAGITQTLLSSTYNVPYVQFNSTSLTNTQQDYYGRRCGTLFHGYCTSTYTEVTVLLLWSSSNATLKYPCRYSNRVAVWVLHGNSRVTSQKQHCYFSVGTREVTL